MVKHDKLKTTVMPLDCKSIKGTLKITAFTTKTPPKGTSIKRGLELTSPEKINSTPKKP